MARPYQEVLAEVDGGLLSDDISAKIAAVVTAVKAHAKPGTVTIKLSIKPNGADQVFLDASCEAKAPNTPINTSVFFAKDNGDLVREDPNKENIRIRAVS